MTARTDIDTIRACIQHCAARRDGRGRWRAEDRCNVDLQRGMPQSVIPAATAAAARALGAWLAAQGVGRV